MSLDDAILHDFLLTPEKERYPMSHAPYLAEITPGQLMVVWFSGSREWSKDVHLLTAPYDPATGVWGEIKDIVTDVGYSVGNSVVLRDSAGRIHLWYVRTKGYWSEGETIHQIYKNLDSPPISSNELPLAVGWLIRGRPVLRGNTVFLPVYEETDLTSAVWSQELSGSGGKLGEITTAPGGLIHPTLVDVGPNEFRCFYRNPRAPNRMYGAYSMNRGGDWSRPSATELPNPNSGFDVAKITNAQGKPRLVCVYNDSETKRFPLSLAVSDNMGLDWEKKGDFEQGPGEYSYPSLMADKFGLHLAYTHDRTGIRCLSLDLEKIGS